MHFLNSVAAVLVGDDSPNSDYAMGEKCCLSKTCKIWGGAFRWVGDIFNG
jgi:hypothetical protein